MIDVSLVNISQGEVSKLANLSLNIAYAIHVEKWDWYERPLEGYPFILLDEPPTKPLNKDIGLYIGDQRFIYRNIPKYNEDLYRMFEMGRWIIAQNLSREFMLFLEEEVNSSNHARLCHAGADKRCRAILRLFLHYKNRIKFKEPKIIKPESVPSISVEKSEK